MQPCVRVGDFLKVRLPSFPFPFREESRMSQRFGNLTSAKVLALATVLVLVVACGDNPRDRALTGGAIGAAGGAVVGSTVGSPVGGAVVGGLGGGAVCGAAPPGFLPRRRRAGRPRGAAVTGPSRRG